MIKVQLIVYGPRTRLGKRNYAGVWPREEDVRAVNITPAVAGATSAPQMSIKEFRRIFGDSAADTVAKALQPRRKSVLTVTNMTAEELTQYLAQRSESTKVLVQIIRGS